jgi:hypothetical protein
VNFRSLVLDALEDLRHALDIGDRHLVDVVARDLDALARTLPADVALRPSFQCPHCGLRRGTQALAELHLEVAHPDRRGV